MGTRPPSYEDVVSAFSRVRADSPKDGREWRWDINHPLRRFELAEQWANITRSCERLAAYRLAGQKPPLGYYDNELRNLHTAIKLLMAERATDHGGAEWTLRDNSEDTAALLGISHSSRQAKP